MPQIVTINCDFCNIVVDRSKLAFNLGLGERHYGTDSWEKWFCSKICMRQWLEGFVISLKNKEKEK